jgi:hypothetical protein
MPIEQSIFPGGYSETRVTVPRSHNSQVDVTISERRPSTELIREHQLWFRSKVVPFQNNNSFRVTLQRPSHRPRDHPQLSD